jgi:dihydrolipoamide dehydrogenase
MNTPKKMKIAVVGAGTGGYAAAFRAADFGHNVFLFDQNPNPGGVCLYRGCIPSKALLHAAKVMDETRAAADIGLKYGDPEIDLNQLRQWKKSVVDKLTSGLGILAKQRKVTFIQGTVSFVNSGTLSVQKSEKTEKLSFDRIILATGSRNIPLPGAPDDLWDSKIALDLPEIPRALLVIGGGYIGLELGSVYATLGSHVTVVEMLPQIMTGADRDLVSVFMRKASGLFEAILTNTRVETIEPAGQKFRVLLKNEQNKSSLAFDRILVSIGRKPNTGNLGLENTRVQLEEGGFVRTAPDRSTDDPLIYAVGDITGGPLLAHKATHEGRIAAEAIAGEKVAFEPVVIPGVVYTNPEIAFCGLTETEAKSTGRDIQIAKFPWAASGRAMTMGIGDGLTKLIIESGSERVLGVGVAGPGAGELISEGALAIEMAALASDIGLTIHPHPTLSETIMEAADVFYGTSTNIYRPKRH